MLNTKPKRQKVLPAALADSIADLPPSVAGTAAASAVAVSRKVGRPKGSKNTKKAAKKEESPNQLYGLYSTDSEDWLAGCWFPVKYCGPVTSTTAAATATDAASGSASSSTPAAAAPAPSTDTSSTPSADADRVLIRWISQSQKRYSAEPLHLAFVRSAAEFTRLAVTSMRPGKRVLVRDVLEDADFTGASYWLATIVSDPLPPLPTKKRASGKSAAAVPLVKVEYQNPKWTPTLVPIDTIYVLHKTRAKLELIVTEDSDKEEEEQEGSEGGGEEETEDEAEEGAQMEEEDTTLPASSTTDDSHAPFAHSSPQFAAIDESMLVEPEHRPLDQHPIATTTTTTASHEEHKDGWYLDEPAIECDGRGHLAKVIAQPDSAALL